MRNAGSHPVHGVVVHVGVNEVERESAIEGGSFAAMHNVICAAADVDEVIVEQFTTSQRRVLPPHGHRGRRPPPPIEIVDVYGNVIDLEDEQDNAALPIAADDQSANGVTAPSTKISIYLPGQTARTHPGANAPESIDTHTSHLTARRLAEQLSVRIARSIVDTWKARAADFAEWTTINGRLPLSTSDDAEEKSLRVCD